VTNSIVRALATLAFVLLAVPAHAVQTARGATGLATIPTAEASASTGLFINDGKIGTGGTYGVPFAEAGVQNRQGTNFYEAKIVPLPAANTEGLIPGIAIGMRGVASDVSQREWYLVATKLITFPIPLKLSVGTSRRVSWSAPRKLFYGVELPFGDVFSLMADRDEHTGQTAAGARLTVGQFAIYDYVLDVLEKGPAGKRANVLGVCYQQRF
jgi:hypothetical protein